MTWTPLQRAEAIRNPAQMEAIVQDWLKANPHEDVNHLREFVRQTYELPVYRNDVYQATVRDMMSVYGPIRHLSIKRIDRAPVRDWRDLQRIKNELIGEEYQAVEIYPPESMLVDTANQYHLWAMIGEAAPWLPEEMGLGDKRVTMDGTGEVDAKTGTRQRPLEKT